MTKLLKKDKIVLKFLTDFACKACGQKKLIRYVSDRRGGYCECTNVDLLTPNSALYKYNKTLC